MNTPLDTERIRILTSAFRMPSVQTMTSRKTSITNAFVCAIIPSIRPLPEDIEKALCILGMDPTDVRCAYCGDRATEWDHLRPLVMKRRPTGFVSEIANLVPACGKCNQSKGNKPWRDWMLSNAKLSPTGRGLPDIATRISRLEAYERWGTPTRVEFEVLVPNEDWGKYWTLCERVIEDMRHCQEFADAIRAQVVEHLGAN